MPLLSILVAPGSSCRLLPDLIRVPLPYGSFYLHNHHQSYPRPTCPCRRSSSLALPRAATRNCLSTHHRSHRLLITPRRPPLSRKYSSAHEVSKNTIEPEGVASTTYDSSLQDQRGQNQVEGDGEHVAPVDRRAYIFGPRVEATRPSKPAQIIDSIKNTSWHLYKGTRFHSKDHRQSGQNRQRVEHAQRLAQPASLHYILSQHIQAVTTSPAAQFNPILSAGELHTLHRKGYTLNSVEKWSQSVLEKHSVPAASLFKDQREIPPLFLVSIFLQRKHIKNCALGIIMRHLQARKQLEDIPWESIQVLVVRLLRHARKTWPEAIPWIASFYVTEAARIYPHQTSKGLSDMTHFSNTLLQLISLPASVNTFANVTYQEEAQFQVLQFMASCEPALVLTRTGFRAVARNQLAHPKTAQEREWASLKGPGWPPWKENRNAMDEEKGYEFGASRASRIMHKMYEAGYEGGAWEQIAEIYAGWDTDRSPTIQWRTLFPHVSTAIRHKKKEPLIWAARVRATRTRREAWACFLACEASSDNAPAEVYLAMFQKLFQPVVAKDHRKSRLGTADSTLPGDTPDVMPDARSPLHYVHLDEPVPRVEDLLERMIAKNINPTGRLVAFLIGALPTLTLTLQLLETTQSMFDGGVKYLLDGSLPPSNELPVPDYFFASFIKFLCRFGRLSSPPSTELLSLPIHLGDPSARHPTDHRLRLEFDGHYRVQYALSLLMHYKPAYSAAWAEYAEKIQYYHKFVKGQSKENTAILRATCAVEQYKTICKIFQTLDDIDHVPNDSLFLRLCMTARRATHVAYKGLLDPEDAQFIFSTAPRTVRVAFLDLIATDVDLRSHDLSEQGNQPAAHIPSLPVLHLYVRTLGMFRDYEGLYSLSIWMTTHHEQIERLARACRGGFDQLFFILVALRSGLEGTWRSDSKENCASPELVELIKARIEGVKGWAWPSSNEVADYESVPRDRSWS